jgi:co-chaperonin GroES (HSP10)
MAIPSGKVELPDIPDRSEEDFEKMKGLVATSTLIKDGACMVYRHKTPNRTESGLYISADAVEMQNKRRVTGTILKLQYNYEGPLKVKDWVYFTQYAPFAAFPEYPEIQLIHSDDIIMTLDRLPHEVVDDSGRLL